MRVLPDVPAIDKEFDYLVPEAMGDQVRVGTMVRIRLHGRRVGGWVVADDVCPPPGLALLALAKVTGWGPPPDIVALAGWAARRWGGHRASFLRAASPTSSVRGLPPPAGTASLALPHAAGAASLAVPHAAGAASLAVPHAAGAASLAEPHAAGAASLAEPHVADAGLIEEAFATPSGRAVLRLPPAADLLAVVLAAARLGPALVVAPSSALAAVLANRLRRVGLSVATVPRDWAQAAAGAHVVIGARGAAWAPQAALASVVVLDGHDEGLAQEQAPTWNGQVVAAERARRAGVPCVVVSSCPTVELLAWGRLLVPSRQVERSGWAPLEVIDRRRDDPGIGLYSPRLVGLLRGGGRVVCVLNRKGRARLLACGACRELSRCEVCGAAVAQESEGPQGSQPRLVCRRCSTARPAVCLNCGSTTLKLLRVGVSRAREELEALACRPVGEVTRETGTMPDAQVLVGTEAVLHRIDEADGVAFLEFDQELLAPRYRAAEEALALLARASRLVGGRGRGGRVLVQTRVPHHEVLLAALTADPGRLALSEAGVRVALALPPERALALVAGEAAGALVEGLQAASPGLDVLGPAGGRWLVRAADHEALSAALAAVPRPPGRLRVEVDPIRV